MSTVADKIDSVIEFFKRIGSFLARTSVSMLAIFTLIAVYSIKFFTLSADFVGKFIYMLDSWAQGRPILEQVGATTGQAGQVVNSHSLIAQFFMMSNTFIPWETLFSCFAVQVFFFGWCMSLKFIIKAYELLPGKAT